MRTDIILSPWSVYHKSDKLYDCFPESVFFTGNGRFGVRGYVPLCVKPRPIERGLFLAGIFGEIKQGITDFVNLPTPVYETLCLDGEPVSRISDIERELDLETAVLTYRYKAHCGEKYAELCETLFFPAEHPTLLLQRTEIRLFGAVNAAFTSGIELDSCNCTIPDDQMKENTEAVSLAELTSASSDAKQLCAEFAIKGTGLSVTEHVIFSQEGKFVKTAESIGLTFTLEGDSTFCLDKLSFIRTSRDVPENIEAMPIEFDFDALLNEHQDAWKKRIRACDIPLEDSELQTGLRYSMYQLMASCSRRDGTVSIGARGLTHARYKGCYFWDTDMFMLPFFLKNDLEAAKNLCRYRVDALPAAKRHSASMNTLGARYPWMASLDGSEQCETWDIGCSELHVTADVVYALDSYCKASGDIDFYLDGAAEVYIETARFWMSRYTFRKDEHHADLLWCKGPDEYCGVSSNNLYTNAMVRYNLALAGKAADALKTSRPEIYARLGITDEERMDWDALRECISYPRDPDTNHLTTDDTFHLLEPINITELKPDDCASYHHVCFDRLQRYKVVKQADVLLLMTRLPDEFSTEEKQNAWQDFEPICLHDSTLSFASHALFALQNGIREKGKEYLRKALLLDLCDIMGNTGKEGLHLACMGEAWQAATLM